LLEFLMMSSPLRMVDCKKKLHWFISKQKWFHSTLQQNNYMHSGIHQGD
jgi:hypothetical protein